MTTRTSEGWLQEASPRFEARVAGCLYLLIILGGLFAPFAVAPSGMMLGNSALPAVARILAAKQLYIVGGIAQLLVYTCDVGVALIFYELLKPVHRQVSLVAAFFRLVFVAIASANMMNHFAPLVLLRSGDDLSALSARQLQALALVFIRMRTYGFDIALLFFGFHWLCAGYLFFKSSFFPRLFGLGLAIGGLGYIANIAVTAIPATLATHLFPYILLPAGIAELVLTLWLIDVGVHVPKWRAQASAAGLSTPRLRGATPSPQHERSGAGARVVLRREGITGSKRYIAALERLHAMQMVPLPILD
jgi:hypothetical protein